MRLDRVSAGDDEWQAVANFQNVLHQSTVQGVEVAQVSCMTDGPMYRSWQLSGLHFRLVQIGTRRFLLLSLL